MNTYYTANLSGYFLLQEDKRTGATTILKLFYYKHPPTAYKKKRKKFLWFSWTSRQYNWKETEKREYDAHIKLREEIMDYIDENKLNLSNMLVYGYYPEYGDDPHVLFFKNGEWIN